MKDAQIVFKERLENISNLTKEEQYLNCFQVAKDLTNFGWTMELEDEVLISEVLESMFKQMGLLLEKYQIPNEIRDEIKIKLSLSLKKLIEEYMEKDPAKLYACLKELRYVATYYQLNACQTYPELGSGRYFRD